jgi:hypothetical protein
MSNPTMRARAGDSLVRHLTQIESIDRRLAAAGTVFLVTISVYGATLLRGVSSFDAAEMQTVPPVLGIAHPTGYPLWTLLGFLWTRLPLASPALMMNLLSAALFALAAATLAVIGIRLGVRPILAAVAGLTFAFAGETWARATQAEVHSLHTLLAALVLLAWIIAEQTGSSRAALAMVAITSIGLTHHRLMLITALPLLLWFFTRHLKMLRSPWFLLDSALCAVTPLIVYLYIPIRIHEHPRLVNADTSGGSLPIIRGDVFGSHEQAFTRESPGRWLHALPSYGHLTVQWLGWVVAVFAAVGALYLALRRGRLFVGLALVLVMTTYGLSNRTDRDYRWLIMALFVLCVFASVALEEAVQAVGRSLARVDRRAQLLASSVAILIPLFAVVNHFSRYDRTGDKRDATNGMRILSAVAPDAVIWSYWDVRTTLEYLTAVEHVRPDVEVLDHRAYTKYRSLDDATVAVDIAADRKFTGRPLYYIPITGGQRAAVADQLELDPVLQIDLPYDFDNRYAGSLYLVKR